MNDPLDTDEIEWNDCDEDVEPGEVVPVAAPIDASPLCDQGRPGLW